MKSESFKGTVESAYGKQLPSAVSFSGSYEKLEKGDEIPSDEKLNEQDILDVINAKRKASARAKATNEALQAAGIEKPDPKSPEVVREGMIKGLMLLQNLSREQAEQAFALMTEAAGAVKS